MSTAQAEGLPADILGFGCIEWGTETDTKSLDLR